jgi:hypothetical protein
MPFARTSSYSGTPFEAISSGIKPNTRRPERLSVSASHGFTPKVIWSIVKETAAGCEISGLAPHDLRRTCARLCTKEEVSLNESSSFSDLFGRFGNWQGWRGAPAEGQVTGWYPAGWLRSANEMSSMPE